MSLIVKETYVNETTDMIFGETGWEPSWTDSPGEVFRSARRAYGRCVSRVYVDTPDGTKAVGWVFESRDTYGDYYSTETYLRHVWVEYRTVEDEI